MFEKAFEEMKERLLVPGGHHVAPGQSREGFQDVLPGQYTLEELYHELCSSSDTQTNLINIHVLQVSLAQRPWRLVAGENVVMVTHHLLQWIAKNIRPGEQLVAQDELPSDERVAEIRKAQEELRDMAPTALSIIEFLQARDFIKEGSPPEVLLSVLAYTDAEDRWSNEESAQTAREIMKRHLAIIPAQGFITDTILNGFIRPLFSRSQPTSVTTQGRKAIHAAARPLNHFGDLSASNKPWKFQEVAAVTVFKWAVMEADETTISKSWHLFIPPLLTILDDPATAVRVRGLYILHNLLTKTSPKTLKQAGLGDVFEDAVMPTLLFLPTLTPAEQSLILLPPAYRALLVLADVRFPMQTDEDNYRKSKFYDRLMRRGILLGFSHSKENAAIMELLLAETDLVLHRMEFNAVKHLKDIIPILSSILTDPFSTARTSLLHASLRTTQTLVLNCWPRMADAAHRRSLIMALVISWRNVRSHVEDPEDRRLLNVEQRVTGKILMKSVEGTVDMATELAPLFEADPSLKDLFL